MTARLLIVLLMLAVPLELPGCGPFLPEAAFHLNVDPEAPADFANGKLGILQPTYERLYQVIAYRYLIGVGLNPDEQQAISPGPHEAVLTAGPSDPWLAARNQVPGVKPVHDIDAYREINKPNFYGSYLNCNDDAFRTAAITLARFRGKPGEMDWIAAQDTVFADCSHDAAIPPPARLPELRADRAYQIASAKFYSEQYDAARQDFQTIASDTSSPWRIIAPYLAARCLIRSGKWDAAVGELQHIAANPALARWHASAVGLLNYIRVRQHPAERMHELALALVQPNSQASVAQDLTDYRTLFDRNVKPSEDDDLTSWILSFQAGGAGALEKWRARRTDPWLVAALQAAGPKDASVPELLAAAFAVKPDSPAYITVNYQRVRLMPSDAARTLADQVLQVDMPVSALNQFRAERMRLARNFDEFLRYAPRTPVDSDAKGLDLLDDDSATMLDRAVPLALLKQAAAGTQLPEATRRSLQRTVAIRSLVLAGSPNFDDVFRLLNSPGGSPFVRSGYGRYTQNPAAIDDFRDNWWCAASGTSAWRPPQERQESPAVVADFLPEADRQQAAAEWRKLAALPAGPDWLGAQTLAFAAQHPQDPRVPPALYLVVRASRYGCTDDKTGDFSRRAFDLLHRRYPSSEWAKKTPYWYR
ncbi:MAG TPA: hypothetical protein VHW09_07045 [Bryobacteraceae bacterium]|jgi:hypothetical protein|nr:hypothetical protein [Bryobacteraceae bacterium]